MPKYADQEKTAESPYRYIFTGWSPTIASAISNTTYTATFKKVVDLSLLTDDWTAADGDEIGGETTHRVTIPGGATVTINGIEVAGSGGGADVPAPAFAEGGESVTTKFEKGEGNTWNITVWGEIDNDASGASVADGQINVYRGEDVDDVTTPVTPTKMTKKSAVKVEMTVEAPTFIKCLGKWFCRRVHGGEGRRPPLQVGRRERAAARNIAAASIFSRGR